jgi:hypothetical protein
LYLNTGVKTETPGFKTASEQLADCSEAVFEKRVLIGFNAVLSLFSRKN